MVIENLTRFLPACSFDKTPMPIMVQTLNEDSYVRFLDVKEASSNCLQQLKAEILSICDEAEEQYNLKGMPESSTYFGAIRAKLSAV